MKAATLALLTACGVSIDCTKFVAQSCGATFTINQASCPDIEAGCDAKDQRILVAYASCVDATACAGGAVVDGNALAACGQLNLSRFCTDTILVDAMPCAVTR